jgi:hypothetical protein
MSTHSYAVTVRFFDAAARQIAESKLSCKGAHPGETCAPAYIFAREDLKQTNPQLLRQVAGVAFLVHPSLEPSQKKEQQP